MPAKKKSRKAAAVAEPVDAAPDPRQSLPQDAASWKLVIGELETALAAVPPPPEPKANDLVEAMLHMYFADGLACGYGQEARRRIAETFVDRNEFRVTEAYEVEDLLQDLQIPDLFDRCAAVRESVGQTYNDQNGVTLDFLRDLGIGDRNNFFQRTPAIRPHVSTFLTNVLTLEELCFSDKSTLRAQQRLGMDAKDDAAMAFVARARELLAPYGHLPLDVGKHLPSGKPNLTLPLSPACILARLLPGPKKR
ncbi:MAG: hypothetical protein AB7O97_01315 [Planctomycetota bacterium]